MTIRLAVIGDLLLVGACSRDVNASDEALLKITTNLLEHSDFAKE